MTVAPPVGAPKPITHRRVLAIAVPIVLSNVTVPILGAVDTGVVGQLGDPVPIGAVGIGAIVLATFYWVFGFLRMGTTGLVSQAIGAEDQAEADALLSRALLIGFLAALGIILVQIPLFAAAFAISPASPEVETLARDYMGIRIWSAPATIALYAVNGWLIAAERTRHVLFLQLWMNGLNIVLDLWLVLGLGFGVKGVAWATFIAEWSGLALGLFFLRDVFRRPFWRVWSRVADRTRLLRMAAVNGDILIRSLLLQSIILSFLFRGAAFGDIPLAANQILLQFLEVSAFALDGFAFAAETLVGNAMGRRSRTRLRRSFVLTSVWSGGTVVFLCLGIAVFGGSVIDILTTAPDVREEARRYLPWLVLAPLLSLPAWMLDGVFIGATRTRDMRNMMIIATAIYFAALWLLSPWENHGLWLALVISGIARGVTLGLKYPELERAAEP